MKIAFVHQPWNRIVHGAPQGSVPIWTSEISRRLGRDHEVYLYSRRFGDQRESEIAEGLNYLRIDDPFDPWIAKFVQPLTQLARRGRSPFTSRLFYPQFYRRVARDIARRGIDIVHLHSFPQAASIIRQENPTALIVVHLHVEWLNSLPPRVARRQIRDADLIIGCSEYLAEETRRALPEAASRIKTVMNGVDVERFTPAGRDDFGGESGGTVLFVGRISPEKGLHILLDAFERSLEKNPDLRLDIIGHDAPLSIHVLNQLADSNVVASLRHYYDTTTLAKLRTWLRLRYPRRLRRLRDTSYGAAIRLTAQRRLATKVRFLGFVANHDLPQHYRRVQLVCLPSLTETFGIPLVEAMACGTPTVASRAGGMPEIVDHGTTGLLLPAFDSEALSNAITELMSDVERRRRMGEAARRRAVDRFSWDTAASGLLQLYQSCVAGRVKSELELEAIRQRGGPSNLSAGVGRHVPELS
jgi:glycosyltransferase involved in cell wall biosynthesis